MIFVRVHRAFGAHHKERGNADVPQRLDGPAVVARRPRKAFGKVQPNLVPFEQSANIHASRPGGLKCADRLAQADASSRSNRRVLLSNELERLGGPRHQLAVEAHPIRVEPLPESACVERSPHGRQQLTLQRGIFRESTAGARVTDATLVFENTESLAGDVMIPAHDDDGAGPMCFCSTMTVETPLVLYAMHMLRLGFQGVELLTTGRLSLPMREPERSYLLDVRRGKVSEQECLTRAGELERELAELEARSALPEAPEEARVGMGAGCVSSQLATITPTVLSTGLRSTTYGVIARLWRQLEARARENQLSPAPQGHCDWDQSCPPSRPRLYNLTNWP
jgi:hypothetical protein